MHCHKQTWRIIRTKTMHNDRCWQGLSKFRFNLIRTVTRPKIPSLEPWVMHQRSLFSFVTPQRNVIKKRRARNRAESSAKGGGTRIYEWHWLRHGAILLIFPNHCLRGFRGLQPDIISEHTWISPLTRAFVTSFQLFLWCIAKPALLLH